FFQAEDGIRDRNVTGVQTCALPIFTTATGSLARLRRSTASWFYPGTNATPRCMWTISPVRFTRLWRNYQEGRPHDPQTRLWHGRVRQDRAILCPSIRRLRGRTAGGRGGYPP